MKLSYPFSTREQPEVKDVGGKALSLILTTRAGFPVPPGFILTTSFFVPWFDRIFSTREWEKVKENPDDDTGYKEINDFAESLLLDKTRKECLFHSIDDLKRKTAFHLFAVRSSSPLEDLDRMSFAGMYTTSLGVTEQNLIHALKRSFISAIGKTVLLYKKKQGLDNLQPDIAVIVQALVDSSVSGVGFSINPLNNCYDEAVINANFGLGESVVSGQATPDLFVMDKTTFTLIEKKRGKKETAARSVKGSVIEEGIEEKVQSDKEKFSLDKDQVAEITDMIINVESFFKKPIDIEWAYKEDMLFLLQARPVTSYLPIPPEMRTKPGEEKYLYGDRFLSKQGIDQPLSVMGLEAAAYTELEMTYRMMGTKAVNNLKDGLLGSALGKMYTNVSNNIKLTGRKRFVSVLNTLDAASAEIINNLKKGEYVRKKIPKRLKGILLKTLICSLGLLKSIYRAYMKPDLFHNEYRDAVRFLEKGIDQVCAADVSFKEFFEKIHRELFDYIFKVSGPAIAASELARSRLKKLFKNETREIREKAEMACRALPHNITIDMGLEMYNLAQARDIVECDFTEEFVKKLKAGDFLRDFTDSWNRFMKKFGFRCPKELDIATPRFYEKPGAFFNQLKIMSQTGEKNPLIIYEKGVRDRENAYNELVVFLKKKGIQKEKKLRRYYRVLSTLGGYRELPKYYWIKILDLLRKRVLKEAGDLLKAGRLDSIEQVFDLTIDELDTAIKDPDIDLRDCAVKNTRVLNKLKHIRHFPRLIDSRGKILRTQTRVTKNGEIAGEPVSPGFAKGRIKVLNTPDEKPLLPGEILVARAADPGWTPLFINAGGIILEVGGLLQHGALVAREYCKPCIAGIEDVTVVFKDGEEIEMDGASGIIRKL